MSPALLGSWTTPGLAPTRGVSSAHARSMTNCGRAAIGMRTWDMERAFVSKVVIATAKKNC
eukprot:7050274-Pyramimonas_sp.AAC.1